VLEAVDAEPRAFKVPTGVVFGIGLSRHRPRRIATANQDTVMRIFDVETGELVVGSHSLSDMSDVDFSLDDRRVAVASTDGSIAVFDSADGRALAQLGGGAGWMSSVVFSPHDEVLAAADDRGRIQLLPVADDTKVPPKKLKLVREIVKAHLGQVIGGVAKEQTGWPC
jgi:WD40 repeat protein